MANQDEIAEGFNAGYTLEKYRPELTQQLLKATQGVDLPFFEGFQAGSKEMERERAFSKSKGIAKLKEFSKDIPRPTQNRSKDAKDKGFDMER